LENITSQLKFMTQGVQILSLIGALLVLASFICKGEKNIRIVNTIGSFFCIIYSLLTKQWSNLILNIIIAFINIYNLFFSKQKLI
jgi:lipid-A-disaccharide synthase-like uncharacterized protein